MAATKFSKPIDKEMIKHVSLTLSGNVPSMNITNIQSAISSTTTWDNTGKTIIGIVVKRIDHPNWIVCSAPSYNSNVHTVSMGVRNFFESQLTITADIEILYI